MQQGRIKQKRAALLHRRESSSAPARLRKRQVPTGPLPKRHPNQQPPPTLPKGEGGQGGRRDRLMPRRLQQQSEKSFLIFKSLEIVNFPLCSDTMVYSLISNISADF